VATTPGMSTLVDCVGALAEEAPRLQSAGVALSEIRLSGYVSGLRQRQAARDRASAARRERIEAALPAAARLLARQFGVTKVVLFGSFARGDAGLGSDVDLLVEGLPPAKLFEAMAALSRDLEADVDLVPACSARPEVLQRALSEGRVLHA
jgi:uncharacterized protein